MELKHSFTVPVSVDRAWDVLLDVERVAPCMPGATLDSVDGDDITGKIKVKVGPISMTYAGKASFTERNREAGLVVLEASGKDTRGAGTASATVRSELTAAGDQTEVTVLTTLNVTGKPAQFGRGVLNEVGGKLIGIFATNLAEMIAADPGSGSGVAGSAAAAGGAASGGADSAGGADMAAPHTGTAEPPSGAKVQASEKAPGADLAQSIEDLNLPIRAYNSLRREGVHTIADLVTKTADQLLAIDNIGPASVEEIRQRLSDHGLSLSDAPLGEAKVSANGAASPNGISGVGTPKPAAREQPGEPARTPLRPVPSPSPEPSWQPDDDAIDLLSVAGFPVLKRAIPIAAGVVAAAIGALIFRTRRRSRRH
jgi:carbon monoxide dehydrogenase subunit G